MENLFFQPPSWQLLFVLQVQSQGAGVSGTCRAGFLCGSPSCLPRSFFFPVALFFVYALGEWSKCGCLLLCSGVHIGTPSPDCRPGVHLCWVMDWITSFSPQPPSQVCSFKGRRQARLHWVLLLANATSFTWITVGLTLSAAGWAQLLAPFYRWAA